MRPCECCGKPTLALHHKFPQTKRNRTLYGAYFIKDLNIRINLIDHPLNKQYVCPVCNAGHAGQGRGLIVWTERDFCRIMSEHFNCAITPLTKSGKGTA